MMKKLTIDLVMQLHTHLINETGGADNVREMGLLESALEGPYATFGGQELYPTLEEKAARLGFALISNHAFVDGNKRIGIYVTLIFLRMNGYTLTCSNDDVIRAALGVASGAMRYDDLLAWVRQYSHI